ncbi:hypothetical protein BGX28_001593 [Mortierella sp. GBA30]|nr:hypothetical protein BGX28_001593 [Mortierella sp. GBA30]
MTASHLARHIARRRSTAEDEPVVIPRSHTFRQFRHLDNQAEALHRRRQEEIVVREEEYKRVRMKIGPNLMEVQICVEDFMDAMGLPDMDLNGLVNFTDEGINNPVEDIEDEDHMDDDDY